MPEQFSIGRDETNDIVLSHPYVSEHHALLTIINSDKKVFHIRDLSTTNGTFKNGESVTEAEFTLSDTIKLAGSVLEPQFFIPLCSQKKSSESEDNHDRRNSRKKSDINISSTPKSSKGTLLAIASALIISILIVYYSNKLIGINQFIQILSLWSLMLVSLYLAQVIMRSRDQLVTEKQYRQLLLDRWQGGVELDLNRKKMEENLISEGWLGYRKFNVLKRVEEAEGIVSFYLQPHDKKQLPKYRPGQYLTFKLNVQGQAKPVIRCYSLSDRFHDEYYRVTIKKIPPPLKNPELPAGISSCYFHDQLHNGSIVDVKAPSGKFYLNEESDSGVVLIAGGIGLTPMISMINTLTEQSSNRDIWFFYGVRNGGELAMKNHLKSLDAQFDNIHMHLCFSDPEPGDREGHDYMHGERVSVELFKKLLPSNNFEFYICGPPPMMQSVTTGLEEWGVPDKDIYYEAFGPASVKKKDAPSDKLDISTNDITIEFSKSAKTIPWAKNCESILEFAENNEIEMSFGCRAGNCGTCQTAILSGDVHYTSEYDIDVEQGSCLACICVPKSNLVIDA